MVYTRAGSVLLSRLTGRMPGMCRLRSGKNKTALPVPGAAVKWFCAVPKRAATRVASSGDAPDTPGAGAQPTSPEKPAM